MSQIRAQLLDGTPFDAEWQRRCPECGEWIAPSTSAHGSLLSVVAGFCRAQYPSRGRRRLNVTVARPRSPTKDGKPRWSEFEWIRPTYQQRREAEHQVLAERDKVMA